MSRVLSFEFRYGDQDPSWRLKNLMQCEWDHLGSLQGFLHHVLQWEIFSLNTPVDGLGKRDFTFHFQTPPLIIPLLEEERKEGSWN